MSIRLRGLLNFLGGSLLFALMLAWWAWWQARNPGRTLPGAPFSVLVIAAPGGFAISGLIQLLVGVPFAELSDKWNSLKGWQRGVYGIAIVAFAFVLIFGGFAAYVLLLS